MEQELVTETITTQRVVDVKPLRDRLRYLIDMPKPTNQELIEIGRGFHEYYGRENEIENIRATLKRLKVE